MKTLRGSVGEDSNWMESQENCHLKVDRHMREQVQPSSSAVTLKEGEE